MKEEAIELRDSTQESLANEEIEETNSSKKRDSVIKEYRYRKLKLSASEFSFRFAFSAVDIHLTKDLN